jgi:uncharacterized protein
MILRVILVLLLILSAACSSINENMVCVDGNCFTVEVAATASDRAMGLMFRESLEDDYGMLFLFEEENNYPFWMKNTLIPLDIMWISADKKVVFVGRDVVPCEANPCPTVDPGVAAQYVLEINGGLAEELGINVGDSVEFRLD